MVTKSQHRLAVILHADVVGSTALVRKDEQVAHDRIQAAFQGFSNAVRTYGGAVNEIRGDALVAEFSRASDAVLAALAAQEDNAKRNAELNDEIIPEIRVGIALGEVVIADATVTGAGVVLAQRLEQLANAGGICISGAIREAVPDRLPIDYDSLGDREVKGFDESVRVFAVELRPGEALPPPARAGESVETRIRRRTRQWFAAAMITVFLIAAGLAAWFHPWKTATQLDAADTAGVEQKTRAQKSYPPLPTKPSIAVLAFDNLSDDPKQDYLADGLAEDIITDLSKISGLFVIARNSSFSYKGKNVPIKTIARELGVKYVLEGSVRRSDDALRINAQLIEAATGQQLWAERHDGGFADIFGLQDNLTLKVITAVEVELTSSERSTRQATSRNPDAKAYDLVLRATNLLHRLDYADAKKARELLEQAIQRDPNYARPHALLGLYHGDLWHLWGEERDKNLRRALDLAEKAARLDELDPSPHAIAALAHQFLREFAKAKIEANKALTLQPTDAITLATLGRALLWAHRPTEAVQLLERAIRLDPFHPSTYLDWLSFSYGLGGRYDDCVRAGERGAALEPDFVSLHVNLAICYASLGRAEEAQRAGREVLRTNPRFRVSAFARYVPFSQQADIDWGVAGLRNAGLPE
jgi:adenylate cyclase